MCPKYNHIYNNDILVPDYGHFFASTLGLP